MEPEHEPQSTTQYTVPSVPSGRPINISAWLARTSSAFVAEYSVMLLVLAGLFGNLTWLIYTFFSLVVAAGHGGATTASAINLFVLWLGVSSLVLMPVAVVLWKRTQGELAVNHEFKGELPKGGAKGFRTFWLVLAGLNVVVSGIIAIYAPIAAGVAGGTWAEELLGVTLPALLGACVALVGVFLVTRGPSRSRRAAMVLWVVAGLTLALFATDFIWSHAMKASEPAPIIPIYQTPTTPPSYPYDTPTYNPLAQ